MSTIDNLCEWMHSRHIDRVVITNDQRAKLFVKDKESNGDVWTMKKLHNFTWEILPDDLRPKLAGEAKMSFFHYSTLDCYNILVERSSTALKVIVEVKDCWFCQRNKPNSNSILHHKMLYRIQSGNVIYWDRKTLQIPRCSNCIRWHGIEVMLSMLCLFTAIYLFFDNYGWFSERYGPNISVWLGLPILCFVAWQAPRLLIFILGKWFGISAKSKVKKHPEYKAARNAGYTDVLY